MKLLFGFFLSLPFLCSLVVHAAEAKADIPQKKSSFEDKGANFYLKVGSGASFSRKADIHAPSFSWDPSPEGYDSSLGVRPIVAGGIGYEFCRMLSTDVLLSYRPNLTYKKFQTSQSVNTAGFLGNKTRRFNLDVLSLMGTMYLNGRGFDALNWDLGFAPGAIYPIVGGGIGVSQMKIFNFRSTGLPPVDPENDPEPGFGSDNENTIRYRFTYQVMGGFEYRYHNRWAISTGYRWFDVARFKGPRYIRSPEGNAVDVTNHQWRIKFSANEIFVELKILL